MQGTTVFDNMIGFHIWQTNENGISLQKDYKYFLANIVSLEEISTYNSICGTCSTLGQRAGILNSISYSQWLESDTMISTFSLPQDNFT